MGRGGSNKKQKEDDNLKVVRDYQDFQERKREWEEGKGEGEKKRKERRGNREERKQCRRVHTEHKHRLDAISSILGGFFFSQLDPDHGEPSPNPAPFFRSCKVGGKWDACLYEGMSWRELGEKRQALKQKWTQTTTGNRNGRKNRCGESKYDQNPSIIGYEFSVCNGADEKAKERETQMSENVRMWSRGQVSCPSLWQRLIEQCNVNFFWALSVAVMVVQRWALKCK